MSGAHQLVKMFSNHGWTVEEWLPGDDYSISARVRLSSHGGAPIVLEFEAMDDLKVLPLERAYGVNLEGYPHVTEYLCGKKGPREQRLRDFVAAVERAVPRRA